MKFKTTKAAIKSSYSKIAMISYCNAQYLLKFEEPVAYSTRGEGWACDYYDIGGVLISTGYAPIANKNTHCSYDIVRKFDDKAREIVYDYSLNYEEQKAKVKELLSEFIKEIA
jgi:hypothetical protein